MPQATGTLTKVLANNTGFFSLKIGDDWYGGGKAAPEAAEGDMVEVTYNTKAVNGTTYRNATAVKVVNKTATVARSAKAATAAGSGDKDLYWKKKEDRDVVNDSKRELGATRNTAVTIVNFAIEKGYLPALDKAKASEKFDLYLAIVEGTAIKLMAEFEQNKKTFVAEEQKQMSNEQEENDD